MQFSDSNRLSMFYWTIVGGYFVNGSQYDVNPLVDASVFDVKEPPSCCSAPRHQPDRGSSPLVKFGEASREARGEDTAQAIDALIPQLDAQLEIFKVRVKGKKSPAWWNKPGYSGGGAPISPPRPVRRTGGAGRPAQAPCRLNVCRWACLPCFSSRGQPAARRSRRMAP